MFDLTKLLTDVFDPQPGEVATVMVDLPHADRADTDAWRERRRMAEEWREELARLGAERGFTVNPMLTFPATSGNNADLPARGSLEGTEVDLRRTLLDSTLVIAMTQNSATAPLYAFTEEKEDFRAASMPGVSRRMQDTALAADYSEVARRCAAIFELMRGAELLDVEFTTGHRCFFDLRHRTAEVDDGFLPRFKQGDRIINLPSGETFIVPYEGEIDGVSSWTTGTIPVVEDGETVLFHVAANTIHTVEGNGRLAERYAEVFAADPVRANVAEVAFGVNESAQVTGIVLEDEKAGFHWAFGRSEHLGGVIGPDAFASPETVVHQDIVYATDSPIQVRRAVLTTPDGERRPVIADGEYLV